jgi:hypothetical protein
VLLEVIVIAPRFAAASAEVGNTQSTMIIGPTVLWIFAFTLDNAKSEAKTCQQKERILEKMKITVPVRSMLLLLMAVVLLAARHAIC